MISDKPTFWFPAKRYGYGWGLPVRWQGWAVFVGYLVLMGLCLAVFRTQRNLLVLLVYVGVLTVAFMAIVAAKGERPVH